MSAHTPGPWRIAEELSDDCHIVIDHNERGGCVLVERCTPGHDQHDMPNALLVCAAPDLLAALKACEERLREYEVEIDAEFGYCRSEEKLEKSGPRGPEIIQARAAISRAEGRES